MSAKSKRTIVIINLLVGLLHFVLGPNYDGPFQLFVSGYLIDILLPMALYLLFLPGLCKWLPLSKSRVLSALAVAFIGFGVETLQFFNIHIFGETFDPLDYVMYTAGICLGFVIDVLFLKKLDVEEQQ